MEKFTVEQATKFGKAGEYLACAELLLKGYNAFIVSEPTSPYDIILQIGDRLLKIQVKTTIKPRIHQSSVNGRKVLCTIPSYGFNLSAHGTARKTFYESHQVDLFALVALDTKSVAYIPYSKRTGTICFRVPSMKGRYWNEKWMKIVPQIKAFKEEGLSYREIGEQIGINLDNAWRYLNRPPRGKKGGFYFDEFSLERCLSFIENNPKLKESNLVELYLNTRNTDVA